MNPVIDSSALSIGKDLAKEQNPVYDSPYDTASREKTQEQSKRWFEVCRVAASAPHKNDGKNRRNPCQQSTQLKQSGTNFPNIKTVGAKHAEKERE